MFIDVNVSITVQVINFNSIIMTYLAHSFYFYGTCTI